MKTRTRSQLVAPLSQKNLITWALRYGHQNKQARKTGAMEDRKKLIYVETRLLLSALRYFEKREQSLRKGKK